MNNWSAKSALTNRELDCIAQISDLFQQSRQDKLPSQAPEKQPTALQAKKESHQNPLSDLNEMINQAQLILSQQEQKVQENLGLIQKIEVNKGIVVANTKDFQQTCISILKRERMLTKVVREIEKNLQHYKDYEECNRILNHQQLMQDPKELISVLQKIQRGSAFFKQNFEYKKADVFLRRFETLKQSALDKIYLRVIKIMRDSNAECNLRVVQTSIFDKALKLEDIDIQQIIYAKQKTEQFEISKLLISNVEERQADYTEFCDKIYDEYFDHRLYLIEQYLDSIGRLIEQLGIQNVFQYLVKFLEKFTELMGLEQSYYFQQFTNKERFDQFRRENEYDIIHKKLRPHIITSAEVTYLCDSIDLLKEPHIQNNLMKETIMRLYSDIQERLLLLSHYQVQDILSTASINIDQNPIVTKENIPLNFIAKLIEIMSKIKKRINKDIYRGLILEIVQRILSEQLSILIDNDKPRIDSLLLVHANIMLLRRDLLTEEQPRIQYLQNISTADDNKGEITSATQDEQDLDNNNEEEDEIDLDKTKENLWQLLTFSTAQYESVFHFIDESIPKLKKKQQHDMKENLFNKMFNITQRVFKVFIKEAFDDLSKFQNKLKNDVKLMNDQEYTAVFKSHFKGEQSDKQLILDNHQWASVEKVREVYMSSLAKLATDYRSLKEMVSLIQECLQFNDQGIYEQTKAELRLKTMNYIQKFYTLISKYYDKAKYEEMGFKTIQELNFELFGISENEIGIIS